MKVKVVVDGSISHPEVIIHCKELTEDVKRIQKWLTEENVDIPKLSFYKDNREYYISLQDILFFEAEGTHVFGHSKKEVYEIKERLYWLEEHLPKQFVRISKSAIVNTNHIYSIDKTFTSYNLVQFYQSHKQVYVSRFYYKTLKHSLNERRTL